ncbi:MAG: hypothetical protein KGL19_11485 [Bacteroidota bacterium]|nr:hypothetical protein [Bacteroidota bacterium]
MKRILFFTTIISILVLAGCAKNISNNNTANSANSLWPLKQGNNWVYQDSIYDSTGAVLQTYSDSTFISANTLNNSGITFFAYNDSLGWFGAQSYIAVDATNTSLYGLDSSTAVSPYLFFQSASYDGYVIGSNQDYSNPACIGVDNLYGYASTYNINGYTCYKSSDNITDCNGNVIYADVYYVSPGVGVVRIEEYSPVPNSTTNALYLDYSQTLMSYKIN